jgi:alpha-ketoglutarate-dependent taurine dioxygenase
MMQLAWKVMPKTEEVIIQLDTNDKQQIQHGNIPEKLNKKYVLNLVNERPGFFIVKTGISDSNEALQRAVYEKICLLLGRLNTRYGAFYDVKDYGGDYRESRIPVSQTHDTTGFHTDSSALNYYPKYVGLLCIRPALSGGESLLANALDFLEYAERLMPECSALLKIPVIRDIVTPGTEFSMDNLRANRFPVLNDENEIPVFRYMRYWIERGHEKAETPLPEAYIEALNELDKFLNKPENQFRYSMEAGDMLIFNNTILLHNRTAFTNPPESNKERLMVRTWIDAF